MEEFARNCLTGLKNIYDFTIGSCYCASCCKNPFFDQLNNGSATEEEQIFLMREILTFHFMNPFQKWNYAPSRRFPWKLLVHVISIFLVTLQLVLFANSKFAFTNFIHKNQATFSNLFIVNPQQPDGDDLLPNPIQTLYTYKQLQEQVNYTIDQFFALDSVALGSYGYKRIKPNVAEEPPQILVTRHKYAESQIDPSDGIFSMFSRDTIEDSFVVSLEGRNELNWISIFAELHLTLRFTMSFELTTVFLESPSNKPQCIKFLVKIEIQNDFSTGSMPVVMSADPDTKACRQDNSKMSENSTDGGAVVFLSNSGTTTLDAIVIVFAVISIVLCFRSFLNSWKVSVIVRTFFRSKLHYRLKFHQILPLYNMWFVGIIISDILVIVGSSMKLIVSYNPKASSLLLVDYTSIMIGLAVFGQWCGLLRFLSYLDKYNILLITMRLSLPSVVRFIICSAILYTAFLLCGWLVLGPYHPKFRDPFVTSECLFSLVNGDDMYTTYVSMSKVSTPAYVFSKIYLYVFIGMFIYVVLSVFISLISDTYETLHEHWYNRTKGLLKDFASGKLINDPQDEGNGYCRQSSIHPEILLDREEEEDYEFIREAANRFTGSTLVLNQELEVLNSNKDVDTGSSSPAGGISTPGQVQIHPRTDAKKISQV